MANQDLPRFFRVVEALLRERQFEFALTLTSELEEAIAALQADDAGWVPAEMRCQVQSFRRAAEAGIQQNG